MTPQERETISMLCEAQKSTTKTIQSISGHLQQCMVTNAVLTAACGLLFAELVKAQGDDSGVNELIERLSGVIEAHPGSGDLYLKAVDQIRQFAESHM